PVLNKANISKPTAPNAIMADAMIVVRDGLNHRFCVTPFWVGYAPLGHAGGTAVTAVSSPVGVKLAPSGCWQLGQRVACTGAHSPQ
ncbi:MAG TPA: hypothetical protein VKB76_00240, partial [Ktedonobacterales bacterium]|nr:hypothetical protein [Ktedonobacterales bacterium]